MIVISAMTRDRLIGTPDGLPWNIPEEYQQFLDFVRGEAVIMGRRSQEIFGGDLGDSTKLIVVSRRDIDVPGGTVVSSVEEAVRHAEATGRTVFSAGGASIYEQTVPLADEMYLSYVGGEYEGNAYFPEFDPSDWIVMREQEHRDFVFVVYRRAPAAP